MDKLFNHIKNWGAGKELERPGDVKEILDRGEDPLNEWHTDGKQEALSLAMDESGLVIDESEENAQERAKWIELENMASDQNFTSHEADRNVWTEEDEMGGKYSEWRDSQFESLIDNLEAEDAELPFEDQDILGDALRPIREQKKFAQMHQESLDNAQAKQINALPTYSIPEFKFMKEAATFRALMRKEPQLWERRPKFADGSPMTDEQIIEQAATMQEYLVDRSPKNEYSFPELNLMRQCDNWYQIAHKIENYKAQPLMADGAVLSRQQVNELADEYATFRHENPAEFEKMNFELFVEPKIESGEFEKGSFKFTQQTFKGEQQYECTKTKSENGKKISVHYIAKQNPSVVAEPGTLGTFVYQIKGSYSNPKSPGHEIVFIDLILPRMKSKEKPVHA